MNRDRAIDAIRKLTAKARSCAEIGNEAEAEVFEDKAQELMAKYDVKQADIDPPKPQPVHQPSPGWQWMPNADISYATGTNASTFREWVTQDGPWRIRWTVQG